MSERRGASTGRAGAGAKRPWVVWSAVCPTIVPPRGGGTAFGWSTGFATREAAEGRARAVVSRYSMNKSRTPEQRICAAFVKHDITMERGTGYVSCLLTPDSRLMLLAGMPGPWEAVADSASADRSAAASEAADTSSAGDGLQPSQDIE